MGDGVEVGAAREAVEGRMDEGRMEEERAGEEVEAASAALVEEVLSLFIVRPTGTPIARATRARTRRHHARRLCLFLLPSCSQPCAPFSLPPFSPPPTLYSYVSPIVNLCLLSPLTLPPSNFSPPLHASNDPPALPPLTCADAYAMAESDLGAAKSSVGTKRDG